MSIELVLLRPLLWARELLLHWEDLRGTVRPPTVDEVLPDDGSYYNSFPWNCCS